MIKGLFNPLLTNVQSAQLLHDKEEVYIGSRERSDVWDYRHNLALQAVQELLQLALIVCHSDTESVNPVFHGYISYSQSGQIPAYAVQRLFGRSPPCPPTTAYQAGSVNTTRRVADTKTLPMLSRSAPLCGTPTGTKRPSFPVWTRDN